MKEFHTSDELDKYVSESDFLVVVYFYSDYECSRCLSGSKILNIV
jgi:hypothetical protein